MNMGALIPKPAHNTNFKHALKRALDQCLAFCDQIGGDSLAAQSDLTRTRLLVALSGGCDSTVLLVGLKQIIDEQANELNRLELVACHVNHQLRGPESDQDEFFCQELCQSFQIALDIRRPDIDELNKKKHCAQSEESLRELRYLLLTKAAQEAQCQFLLTAHTLDDQVETLLFRLFRGTSLIGISGINLWRQLADGLYLIRPLLSITKQECERFLLENGLTSRQDSSNLANTYTRNYLRNTIIPTIKARFPNFQENIEQFRQIVLTEEDLLGQATNRLLDQLESKRGSESSWSINKWAEQPLAIKRRLIAQALRDRYVEVSFERVEKIITLIADWINQSTVPKKGTHSTLSLNQIWQVRLTDNEITWVKEEEPSLNTFCPLVVKVPGQNIVLAAGRILKIEAIAFAGTDNTAYPFPEAWADEALVDLTKATAPLVLRSRTKGDLIQPLGMSNKVRLKKYLHTHKRPTQDRQRAPQVVLADQEEVIWVPGVGLSEKIKVTSHPSHRLSWLPLAKDTVWLA